MKYPEFINDNDYIYLVSPSFGCDTEPYKSRLEKAITNLGKQNYNIIQGENVYSNKGLLSSSEEICANEIMTSLTSKAKLVWSVAGGEVMIRILDKIPFDEISHFTPKWFLGYSDNTNLTFLLTTISDIATIYGACAPDLGTDTFIDYQTDLLKIIRGEKLKFKGYPKYEIDSLKTPDNPYQNLNLTEDSIITTYPNNKIDMTGRIIGGCIDVLSTIVGTKFDNISRFNEKYSKVIWFLEACDMSPLEVSRRLTQMKLAGWFKNASGFIFGRPIHTQPFMDFTHHDLIIDVLKDLNVPIIMDADIGHMKPQIPVICGSVAHITSDKNEYEIEYILK